MDEAAVVLITGASRGIGRAIAVYCAERGHQTVLCARSAEALADTRQACRQAGAPEPHCLGLDLEQSGSGQGLFREIFQRYGRLDGLVNNAGVLHEALLGMIRTDDIDRVLAVNVRAPLMLMQGAARLMMRRKAGSIVNIGSIMGEQGAIGLSLYAASKAAVVGMTRSAAKELAPHGIRVNAVAPGYVDTDMTRDLPGAVKKARLAGIGMGRAGTPGEIAQLVGFLLSDASTYVTGQIIGIDGQMTI